jgi:hypothetical protein
VEVGFALLVSLIFGLLLAVAAVAVPLVLAVEADQQP